MRFQKLACVLFIYVVCFSLNLVKLVGYQYGTIDYQTKLDTDIITLSQNSDSGGLCEVVVCEMYGNNSYDEIYVNILDYIYKYVPVYGDWSAWSNYIPTYASSNENYEIKFTRNFEYKRWNSEINPVYAFKYFTTCKFLFFPSVTHESWGGYPSCGTGGGSVQKQWTEYKFKEYLGGYEYIWSPLAAIDGFEKTGEYDFLYSVREIKYKIELVAKVSSVEVDFSESDILVWNNEAYKIYDVYNEYSETCYYDGTNYFYIDPVDDDIVNDSVNPTRIYECECISNQNINLGLEKNSFLYQSTIVKLHRTAPENVKKILDEILMYYRLIKDSNDVLIAKIDKTQDYVELIATTAISFANLSLSLMMAVELIESDLKISNLYRNYQVQNIIDFYNNLLNDINTSTKFLREYPYNYYLVINTYVYYEKVEVNTVEYYNERFWSVTKEINYIKKTLTTLSTYNSEIGVFDKYINSNIITDKLSSTDYGSYSLLNLDDSDTMNMVIELLKQVN